MRASEFVIEAAAGKISKRQDVATRGLHTFVDKDRADRTYELNRVMMAVACSDGTSPLNMINSQSWAGRNNLAAPYSEIEQQMLKQAYKAVGSIYQDINKGDLESKELNTTNSISPVNPFKGYKK